VCNYLSQGWIILEMYVYGLLFLPPRNVVDLCIVYFTDQRVNMMLFFELSLPPIFTALVLVGSGDIGPTPDDIAGSWR
jgi:hypothetical protein